jgi:fido (protein-threonine AMPylation protein)
LAFGRPSCEPWNSDSPQDLPIIADRLRGLISRLAAEARRRATPTVDMARAWHREIHQGLHLPVAYYAGEIRDSDPRFPCLFGYEVRVGKLRGISSAGVPAQLARFEESMQLVISNGDAIFPPGYQLQETDGVREIIGLCAAAHGEWVRIHPFANGNGRIARLWANWCALRYGLPPFVRLRPRPSHADYGKAAAASMLGMHELMEDVFLEMLISSHVP